MANLVISLLSLVLMGTAPVASGNSFLPQPVPVAERIYQSQGKIDYEQFRQISTGMTTAQVLKLCGPPMNANGVTVGCLSCFRGVWMYYRDDGWVIEVTFSKSGQVARMTSERQ